jgi:hypothetical protein
VLWVFNKLHMKGVVRLSGGGPKRRRPPHCIRSIPSFSLTPAGNPKKKNKKSVTNDSIHLSFTTVFFQW